MTEPHHTDGQAGPATRRRGADLLTLAAGLGALGVAGGTLLGLNVQWGLAALAMFVGLLLVVGTIRPRRH